jgi:hypothetical protein
VSNIEVLLDDDDICFFGMPAMTRALGVAITVPQKATGRYKSLTRYMVEWAFG